MPLYLSFSLIYSILVRSYLIIHSNLCLLIGAFYSVNASCNYWYQWIQSHHFFVSYFCPVIVVPLIFFSCLFSFFDYLNIFYNTTFIYLLTLYFFCILFLGSGVRKIGPELTSVVNLPLFCLRKIVPDLTSVPVFPCFVRGMPPQHGLMSGIDPCQDPNPRTLGCQSRVHKLMHYATGPASKIDCFIKVELNNFSWEELNIYKSSFLYLKKWKVEIRERSF